MRYLNIFLITTLLVLSSGCATTLEDVKDVAGKKETLALCKAADVVTTIVALNTGTFHETNFLMRALMTGAHGYLPFVLVSAAYVGVMWWWDNPKATMIASGITCGVAAHNGYLLIRTVKP